MQRAKRKIEIFTHIYKLGLLLCSLASGSLAAAATIACRGRLYKKVIKINYDLWKRQPIRITYFVLNHYLTAKQWLKVIKSFIQPAPDNLNFKGKVFFFWYTLYNLIYSIDISLQKEL